MLYIFQHIYVFEQALFGKSAKYVVDTGIPAGHIGRGPGAIPCTLQRVANFFFAAGVYEGISLDSVRETLFCTGTRYVRAVKITLSVFPPRPCALENILVAVPVAVCSRPHRWKPFTLVDQVGVGRMRVRSGLRRRQKATVQGQSGGPSLVRWESGGSTGV